MLMSILALRAEGTAASVRTLALGESLSSNMKHNFDVITDGKGEDIARATLCASYGDYDPAFRACDNHDQLTMNNHP